MTADPIANPGPTARGPSVVFENVRLSLGHARPLDGVDLRIAAGTLHALIGPNGAGKTSLLRCLLGQSAHEGRISLHWPGGRPGRIAYVPQTLHFDTGLPVTVDDFLGLMAQRTPVWGGLRKPAREQIETAVERLGLSAVRKTRLGALSGGELKRVLIAQALMPAPDLLVLDEPMNHLDAPGVASVTRVLKELTAEGRTLLVSLHDFSQVRALAGTVTALARGKAVVSGPPAEALTPRRIAALYTPGMMTEKAS